MHATLPLQVLVMDYCDMGSLADVLNTSLLRHHATGKVALPAILHCLLEVASALHYLHSIGESRELAGRMIQLICMEHPCSCHSGG